MRPAIRLGGLRLAIVLGSVVVTSACAAPASTPDPTPSVADATRIGFRVGVGIA